MASTVLLEARPYKPFKSSEEYLYAMREDLAEWFNTMYPDLNINVDNFMDRLDTGVALCKHANNVRVAAEEYLTRRLARNRSMTKSMTSGAAGPILSIGNVHYLPAAKSGTFFSRDNVSNFITWCRKGLHIFECLLFETDDLIMRKNEKHVILCLLEVARRGAKFGMLAPMLVQMERQIDREIAADNKAAGVGFGTQTDDGSNTISTGTDNDELFDSDSEDEEETSGPLLMYGPQPQIVTNDLKSLDEMVRDLVEKCTCQSQFPMIRVSEGKYRIGDTKILIFVRILRSHVMVRVGGGWDTLSHYLDKHDPCRCKAQHRTLLGAKIKTRTNQTTNGIELHRAQVYYERTPLNSLNSTQNSNGPSSLTSNLSTPSEDRGRSRSPTAPRRSANHVTIRQSPEKSLLASPNMARRSVSPSPRRFNDMKKKQHSLDSNNCAIAEATATPTTAVSPSSFLTATTNQTESPFIIQNDSKIEQNNGGAAEVQLSSNKYENISDNGSEISDEGYRSLGLIQTNAQKRISLHSQASNEDAEINGRLEQTSNESQISTTDEQISPKESNVDLSTESVSSPTPMATESPPNVCSTPVNDAVDESDKSHTDFNKSGIFITDDEISIDIADNRGLRKTGFSEDLYTGDMTTPKKPMSKLPRSPLMTRRRSVENCSENNSGLPLSRKIPIYRSVRKPVATMSAAVPAVKDMPKENCTWSGRGMKKRAPLSADTFQTPPSKPGSPSPLRRSTPTRQSQYDKNGRRIKPLAASVNTSPNKTSASTSPLAQQLLEAAENAQNDKQILEKMKELLSKYASHKNPGNNGFEDFTTAWVNSNGTLDRTSTTPSPKTHRTKPGSIISSAGSTHSKDGAHSMVGGSKLNKFSRIPAPVRANTGLY